MEDILDLQQCLGGVQSCLQRGDLLGAAATVKKFKAVEKVIPVATEDKELMKRAEERLLRVGRACGTGGMHGHRPVITVSCVQTVAARFDVAVAENDSSEVTLCCQLMSVLGNSRQGLERYAKYVDDLLAQYVQEQQQRFKSDDGKAEAGASMTCCSGAVCAVRTHTAVPLCVGISESAVDAVLQGRVAAEAG